MDRSLPGSSVCGILQARTLEWVAISFSRGSAQPGNQIQVSSIVGMSPKVRQALRASELYRKEPPKWCKDLLHSPT